MRLNKRLGQNFLKCESILNFISSKVEDLETIVEIGGGDGRLTRRLAKHSFVYVVELDKRFCNGLMKIENTKIICSDFLKIEPFEVEGIVGNVPYYISSKILFSLLNWKFEKAILMFQKEFAEKMIAKPNNSNYGRLSVTSQYYFNIKLLKIVPKKCFIPSPKVDSAIVEIKKTKGKDEVFDELVRKLFSLKNKKIRNILKGDFKEFSEKRPRQLSLEEIIRIKDIYKGKDS